MWVVEIVENKIKMAGRAGEKKSGDVARARVLTRFLRLLRQEEAAAVKRDASCWTSREGRIELVLSLKSDRDPDFVPRGGKGKGL